MGCLREKFCVISCSLYLNILLRPLFTQEFFWLVTPQLSRLPIPAKCHNIASLPAIKGNGNAKTSVSNSIVQNNKGGKYVYKIQHYVLRHHCRVGCCSLFTSNIDSGWRKDYLRTVLSIACKFVCLGVIRKEVKNHKQCNHLSGYGFGPLTCIKGKGCK